MVKKFGNKLVAVLAAIGEYFTPVTRVIDHSNCSYEEEILLITYSDGREERFQGSCTVWFKLPEFKRCSSAKEAWLSEMYHQLK